MSEKYKVYHPNHRGDDPKEIQANSEYLAACKYCEFLFESDPRDIDETIYINGNEYKIWTEVVPDFCARKVRRKQTDDTQQNNQKLEG